MASSSNSYNYAEQAAFSNALIDMDYSTRALVYDKYLQVPDTGPEGFWLAWTFNDFQKSKKNGSKLHCQRNWWKSGDKRVFSMQK